MRSILIISVLLGFVSCKVDRVQHKKTPRILCSTSIIKDCITQIVGDTIEVVSLMGPGVDPHSYKARPSDIASLNNATIIIYNGLHLEGKMVQLFEKLGERRPVFSVSATIPKSELIPAKTSGVFDPHIWFDNETWFRGLEGVVNELIKIYPERKSDFQQSFLSYRNKISQEQKELTILLGSVPKEQRVLITSHDAFHYFSRRFNIEVKALQGISTTQEPGVKDVVDLVNFIVKRKIRAIFVEHSVSPKAIRTVIESCEKKGWKVKIGGTLYSDALGDASSDGNTYQNMLIHNVQTILKGLKDE